MIHRQLLRRPYYRRTITPVYQDTILDDITSIRFINNKFAIIAVFKKERDLSNFLIDTCIPDKVDIHKNKEHTMNYNFSDYCIITKSYKPCDLKNRSFTLKCGYSHFEIEIQHEKITQSHNLVAMTMFKDDEKLIPSYIEYYTQMGIEHFYLYYNGSLKEKIGMLPKYNNVTYLQWNHPYIFDKKYFAQIGAIHDFLYWAKHFAKYALFNDLDEYIFWANKETPFKDFILENDKSYYGFCNCFVYLKNKQYEIEPTKDTYKLITDNRFEKTNMIYEYGKRSKCVIKTDDIESMGVHFIISPEKIDNIIFKFHEAGIYHVCNFVNRSNVSIDKYALAKLNLKYRVR